MLPVPAGHSPIRRGRSVRRTATLDVTWVDGRDGERRIAGIARDIYSPDAVGAPQIIHQDELDVRVGPDRLIRSMAAVPPRSALAALVGCRAGGQLRAALTDVAQRDGFAHSPLYLLIDDLVGANIVADWAWSRWLPHTPALRQRRKNLLDSMVGVCTGFAPGSSSLRSAGDFQEHHASRVDSLVHPQDPHGWHLLPDVREVSLRRARRIDVWIDGDIIVDAGFQDSATNPDGGRTAVHEYTLRAAIDRDTGTLKELTAFPRILPFTECPGATANLPLLAGAPVAELRTIVAERLPGVLGCTHLNDVVRALADVPELTQCLDRKP